MALEQSIFLLRLWRAAAGQPWRVTLRSMASGAPHHFADLAAALAWLNGVPGETAAAPDDDGDLLANQIVAIVLSKNDQE